MNKGHMIEVSFRKSWPGAALDIAFTAPLAGITALYGRSGSGKSTVLQVIAGGLVPDEGRIVIGGTVFVDTHTGVNLPLHRRAIGYVFQDSRLFPHLSVRGNLTYGLKRATGTPRITLDAATALLGIAHLLDRRPHNLSGGERQRVAIGRALLAQPDVLLMDEPLASLDPARKSELLTYIELLRDELGLPVLYISHEFDEVVRLADHFVLIDAGRVIASGPLLEVAADPAITPLIGRFDAGAVLACRVAAHDDANCTSTLSFDGGVLRTPRVAAATGTALRVRIRARDVAIALSDPADSSISNRLAGTLTALTPRDGPYVEAVIGVGASSVRAVITRDSVARLALKPGMPVFALIKTVALDSRSVGSVRAERTALAAPGSDPGSGPATGRRG